MKTRARTGALAAASALSACAGHPAFSAAVERDWQRRCPEARIEVKATRSYGSSRVYVLDACGKAVEIEERAVFGELDSPGDDGIRALGERLEPDRGERLLPAAQSHAVLACYAELRRELDGPEGDALAAEVVKARVARCEVDVRASVVALGMSLDNAEHKTYWFRAGPHVFAGWLELAAPSCDHRTLTLRGCMTL